MSTHPASGYEREDCTRIFVDACNTADCIYVIKTAAGVQLLTDVPDLELTPHAVTELRKALQRLERQLKGAG